MAPGNDGVGEQGHSSDVGPTAATVAPRAKDATERVAIVGLTPGRQQMHLAVTTAGAVLRHGGSVDDAIAQAKTRAAFAGTMRTNLIRVLDGIGLHTVLDLVTCRSVFDDRFELVSNTSATCHATSSRTETTTEAHPS